MYCTNCGKKMDAGKRKCQNCGQILNSKTPKRNMGKMRKRKVFLMKILICFIIILIVGIVFSKFGFHGYHQKMELTYDFTTDVRNGALYGKAGKIVDCSGKEVMEYADFYITEDGAVSDGYGIIQGCLVDDDGKIVNDLLEEESNNEENNEENIGGNSLKSLADESKCATEVIGDGSYTYMADDGDYFDEIILGVWYDEYGEPKADRVPKGLGNLIEPTWRALDLSDFKFVDGVSYTLDDVKRSKSVINDLLPEVTAMLVSNIQKRESNGEIIYEGLEYTSKNPVIIHGNFDRILNGDNLLVFGVFSGLGADDTPNFIGRYMVIEGDRF